MLTARAATRQGLTRGFAGISAQLIMLALVSVVVMSIACTTDSETTPASPLIHFDVPLFDGSRLNSQQVRGKTVVVNFWASWCVPCREEAPDLLRVWQAYQDKNVLFVGVALQNDAAIAAQTFLREARIDYPNGQDTEGKLATAFQVVSLPNTFIVGADGRLVHRFIGPVKAERLSTVLAQALGN